MRTIISLNVSTLRRIEKC